MQWWLQFCTSMNVFTMTKHLKAVESEEHERGDLVYYENGSSVLSQIPW